MNRDIMLKRIKKYLLTVKLNIQYDNEAGLFDINKHCENFYCGLLNLVYGKLAHTHEEHEQVLCLNLT